MNDFAAAEKVLANMLTSLGFEVVVTTFHLKEGPCMQIESPQSSHIIGKNGDRLEDLQYLLNRIVAKKSPSLPRIKVDCEDYRRNVEADLVEKVEHLAEKVRADGKPARTRPLNAYYRRIVHNALAEYADIETSSADGDGRYKRVQLSRKDSTEEIS